MPSVLPHTRKLNPAVLLRSALIAIYLSLLAASLWIIGGIPLETLAGRVFPYGIPPLLSLICAAFLSLFVLTLERIRTETLLFSLLCVAFAGLNLDILLLGIVEDAATALAISRFDHFFLAVILLGANLHLVYLVCEKKRHWWVVYLAYATGGVIALFTPTDYYLIGMDDYYWGFFARQGPVYSIISTLWLAALFYSVGLLRAAYRRFSDPAKKDKIRYLIYGFMCTAVLSLTNTPAIYGYEVYPLGTFIFVSLLLLAYGLYKYNMRLAIQQLRAFLFYTGHAAIIVAGGFAVAELLPASRTNLKLFSGILTVVVLYAPFRLLWGAFLNIFFKRSPNLLQKEFNRLTFRLSGGHHLQTLFKTTAEWLFAVFLNSRCAMVFFDEKRAEFTGWSIWNPDYSGGFFAPSLPENRKVDPLSVRPDHPIIRRLGAERKPLVTAGTLDRWVEEDGPTNGASDWLLQAGVLVPVFYRDRLQGIVVIGNSSSNRSYSRSEKAVLSSLAVVLGPFIENARLLENLEEQVHHRTRALHAALEETERKSTQIKAKNELITRQNHIILSLFDTTSRIYEFDTPLEGDGFEQLFSFVLGQLRHLFPELDFAILLEEGRTNPRSSSVFSGMSESEQNRILENRSRLDERNAADVLGDGGAKRHTAAQWTLLPMMTGDRRLGKMIIRGKTPDPNTRQVISIFLAQVSAVAQNKLLMHRLETVANTDGLTGVANRAYFEKQHARAIQIARRLDQHHFSILIIDINGLKTVNDTFGHDKGDDMITRVAVLLKTVCRETDTLSRIGGDEFAILLSSTDSVQASRLADRIRERESELAIRCGEDRDGGAEIPVRISIGMAGSDETAPDSVMKLADQRMYADKAQFYARMAQ